MVVECQCSAWWWLKRSSWDMGAIIETLTLVYCPKLLQLGERSRIASFVRIVGFGKAILEARAFVGLGNLIDVTDEFYLGDSSQLGPRGIFYTHGSTGLLYNVQFPHKIAPIRIEANCWTGMNCCVYPGVHIGAKSFIYPGVIVNRDIPEGSGVRPAEPSCTVMPIEKFQARVTTEQKISAMKSALLHIHAAWPGTRLDKSDDSLWTLYMPKRYEIHLLLKGNHSPLNTNVSKVVIWKMSSGAFTGSYPTFIFDELSVAGDWTPFADRIAQFLCENSGTHFTFNSRQLEKTYEEPTTAVDHNMG